MKSAVMASAVLGAAAMLAGAQTRLARRFVVPQTDVVQAIAGVFAARGIQVTADQVKLPMDILSTEEHPMLEVSAVHDLGHLSSTDPGEMGASIRLRCRGAGTCMPFYAVVSWREGSAPAVPFTPVSDMVAQVKKEQAPTIIKTGTPLTLLIDSDGAHISIPVVSLGNAALGQRVRVASPDRKRFYMVEVLNATTVKGSL